MIKVTLIEQKTGHINFFLNNDFINSLLSQACPIADLNLRVTLKKIKHMEKDNRVGDLKKFQIQQKVLNQTSLHNWGAG